YTNVDQAVDFVEKTGCGSLAVAVGNAHGAYKITPNLDFDRIKALRKAVSVPLVLHGCSDIPHEQLQEAVRLGLSKFNIATEYFRACYASTCDVADPAKKESGNFINLLSDAEQGAVDFIRSKMQLLNPNKFSL
ncbi:MAG: class II fructose-bisphosphate aldolase, partial [Acutalibacteraceae bacterium]